MFGKVDTTETYQWSASKRFGWNHHVHVFFIVSTCPLALWSILRFPCFYAKRRIPSVAVLGHAVVLLHGAVVPQAPAVVPHALAVVPHALAVVP